MAGFAATVLQVIPALDAGGAERTTLEIARAIVEAGGRALTASRGGRLAGEIEAAGGRVVSMPVHSKNPLTIWANRARLLDLVRREGVDLVHARSRAPAWSALWAARAAGIPFVTTYHGAYRANGPLKRFYNSAMVRADLVIANSAFTAAAIRAQYDLPPGRLAVIPRGADLDHFDPAGVSPERVEALRRAWGLPARAAMFALLLPARLTPWKGHETAIAALARMVVNEPSSRDAGNQPVLQLIFAGGAQGRGDYAARLRAECEKRGVRSMVHFVGHCADMPAAYALADVVLAPSLRPEAFGRTAVEAGAMARPVIAADHGGARETVIDGETGVLVPPNDPEALADAIREIAAMPAPARARMGATARARVAEKFSTAAMCAATLEAYRALLARRAAAPAGPA
ncbi:glycosyltransferase family 4 protein [Amphiplicatus metriothermophilus]|uniref:Glycosyltransferase involved in cell wall bisynthesis n=1 Tax=Amphiplicatus metriothermophilus TaxID=1519374 RepID=A0A239PL95_9PROT|nr:glycosyltransferase family 4 protein [Amphiplicatus metriothermophilus]MBB5517277.1 glycosyltransferase involved in cell wall biosynthesis [Amphiplicatus metriothermophilus]SNT68387.1 Glycosyltransferase involved in cell wall bisynthesis [Amphiplicatus metriothermophilus]